MKYIYIVDYYNKETGVYGMLKTQASHRKAAMDSAKFLLGKDYKVVGAYRKSAWIA